MVPKVYFIRRILRLIGLAECIYIRSVEGESQRIGKDGGIVVVKESARGFKQS